MGTGRSGDGQQSRFEGLEHELTEHLERAHELGTRAQRANDAATEAISRAMEIADRLRGRVTPADDQ
jgi:hypothetical protein